MYRPKEVEGVDKVNRVKAALLEEYAFKSASYLDRLVFLKLLRTEAVPEHDALIADLFEKITLPDVKATEAKSVRLLDGRYEVNFTVEAKKLYAGGQGRETWAPPDEPLNSGLFSSEPGRPGYTSASELSFMRQRIKTGKQTLTVMVDKEPAFIGVDPQRQAHSPQLRG